MIELFRNLDRLGELPGFVTKEHYSEVRKCFYEQTGIYEKWYVELSGIWQAIMAGSLMEDMPA